MSARISSVFALVLGLMMVSGGSAVVAADRNAPSSGKEIAGDGIYKYAQLGLFYNRDSIVRSANVKKVTNPRLGIYCIKPIKKWNTSKFMGIAAVEWGSSKGDDLLAYWNNGGNECPNNKRWFQVRTYNMDEGGDWVVSDKVAFTFYVP